MQASSGASGNADATVAGVAGTPSSASGAKVNGHSGDTGNAIAEAVDLSTWVTVTTHSGDAGAVTSIARGAGKSASSGGSVITPSKPSHNTVHTGPISHAKPKAPALISAAGSSSTQSGATGSQSVTTTSRASAHSASSDVTSSSLAVSVAGADSNPIAESPAVVPAAKTSTLGTQRRGSQAGNIGLITMPFLLLGMVALAAVIVPRWRRSRRT